MPLGHSQLVPPLERTIFPGHSIGSGIMQCFMLVVGLYSSTIPLSRQTQSLPSFDRIMSTGQTIGSSGSSYLAR
jgi:hypothetical protein